MAAITDNVSRVEIKIADAESVGDISGTSSEVDNNLNPKNPVVPRRTFKVNKKPGRKLKVPADWSDKYVYKLIEFVRDSPVLWDSDVKGSSIQTRRNLWTELSQKVLRSKYDPEEVNAKWKHMRVQYKNYANRKPIPGRTLNPIVWRFYRYMQFVDKINIDVVFPPAESESDTDESENENSNPPTSRLPSAPSYTRAPPPPARPIPTHSRPESASSSSQSSVATNNAETIPTASSTKPSTQSEQPEQQQQQIGEYTAFAKFLASELRLLQDINLARQIKFHVTRYFVDLIDEEQPSAAAMTVTNGQI